MNNGETGGPMKRLWRGLGWIQIDQFADEVEFLDEGKTKQESLKWRDGMFDVFPDKTTALYSLKYLSIPVKSIKV